MDKARESLSEPPERLMDALKAVELSHEATESRKRSFVHRAANGRKAAQVKYAAFFLFMIVQKVAIVCGFLSV